MFYNTKVSTPVGIIIIIIVATFVGWMIVRQYSALIMTQTQIIELSS